MQSVKNNLMAFYLTSLIIYPNEVVTPAYLSGVSGHLLYQRNVHADVTYEHEFDTLTNPSGPLIKMSQKKYIDSFFSDGTIQLGTLSFYSSLQHKEQGDNSEGSLIIVGQNNKMTAFAEISSGFDNYLFCCYDGIPETSLLSDFGYDSFFIINDPVSFSFEISKKIQCKSSFSSRCIYKRDKVLIGKTSDDFNFNVISDRLSELVGKTKYFLKPLSYSKQKEYRFMWQMPHDVLSPLIIKCPEAIKYCSLP